MLHGHLLLSLFFCLTGTPQSDPQDQSLQPTNLKLLSIEELASVDVTSVSRRPERLSRTAAAISVVRDEDVRRSGAVILAEALRLADGIDVARVNGGAWGVTSRGFNSTASNKMLVLVDGRSTYSSLFGGTFWDVQDTVLADLDRIEVIRGPGGTIWGANAVNGVINIISKPVAATQGGVLTLIGGTNERAIVAGRYGGRAGDGHFRIYGKYRMRAPQMFDSGGSAEDEVHFGQSGFRIDSDQARPTRWSVSADLYRGTSGFADRPDGDVAGGNVVGHFSRSGSAGELAVRALYDRSYRKVPLQFEETRHAGELDVQHRLIRARHDLVFGATARAYRSDDLGIAGFRFEPQVRHGWTMNVFAQDELEILPERFYLTLGSKFGRNNFTGLEVQPNARVRFHPTDRQMTWAAVSRAVRLPTRFDMDLLVLDPLTGAVVLKGPADFDAESVIAVEGGYRVTPHRRLSIDAAVFTNRYDHLRSQELRFEPVPVIVLDNLMNARTGGIEVGGTAQLASNWRVHGSYSWLRKTLSFDAGSTDPTGGIFEGNDPSHVGSARSYVDLPRGFALDAIVRFVGQRPSPVVAAYAEMDLRLGWMVRPSLDLSLVGQNLLHDRHEELASPNAPRYSFPRSVFVRSAWRF